MKFFLKLFDDSVFHLNKNNFIFFIVVFKIKTLCFTKVKRSKCFFVKIIEKIKMIFIKMTETAKKIDSNENNQLGAILSKLIDSTGMELSDFCRKVNIGYSTVYSMMNGVNVSPRVLTLLPIAKFFDISLEQLMGVEELNKERKTKSIKIEPNKKNTVWESKLFTQCTSLVNKVLAKRDGKIGVDQYLEIVKEVYIYTVTKKLTKPDANFVEWFSKHHLGY